MRTVNLEFDFNLESTKAHGLTMRHTALAVAHRVIDGD